VKINKKHGAAISREQGIGGYMLLKKLLSRMETERSERDYSEDGGISGQYPQVGGRRLVKKGYLQLEEEGRWGAA